MNQLHGLDAVHNIEDHEKVKANREKYYTTIQRLRETYGLKHTQNFHVQLLIKKVALDEIMIQQWQKILLTDPTDKTLRKDLISLRSESRHALEAIDAFMRGKVKRPGRGTNERMRLAMHDVKDKVDNDERFDVPRLQFEAEKSNDTSGETIDNGNDNPTDNPEPDVDGDSKEM